MKLIKLTSAMAMASMLSACSVWDGWFEDEEDEKKALTPITSLFTAKANWDTQVGDGVDEYFSRLAPVLAYDKLFAASRHGEVTAMDPVTGKELWSQNFAERDQDGLLASVKGLWSSGKSARLTGIAAAYEKLFIGSENGNLIALDVNSGELIWQLNVKGEILATPFIDSGAVLVTTSSGKLIGVDADKGEQLWSFESDVPPLTLRGVSSPVASGGGAIFGTATGKVSVVIIENGQAAWEQTIASPTGATELDRIVDIDIKPLISGGILYTASYSGTLAALDLRSGRVIWKREYSSYRPLMMEGNALYVVDRDSNIYAVDRRTGVELWSQTGLSHRQVTGAAAVGSFIVVGDFEGYIHWLRADDGEFVARQQVNSSGYYSAPVVDGRTVYIQARDGEVIALETP